MVCTKSNPFLLWTRFSSLYNHSFNTLDAIQKRDLFASLDPLAERFSTDRTREISGGPDMDVCLVICLRLRKVIRKVCLYLQFNINSFLTKTLNICILNFYFFVKYLY